MDNWSGRIAFRLQLSIFLFYLKTHLSIYLFMKKMILSCLAASVLMACADNRPMTVVVSNPLDMERSGEMVEVSMDEITRRLQLADTAQIVVLDAEGTEVPYQITYDDKVIFPATVAAGGKASYTIQEGKPQPVEVKTCGRQYPERLDDMAWENDLVAFRAYGPALQQTGERGFGYDLFLKRGTSEPVLEDFYAKELDKETRARAAELRKTDPKAASELLQSISYHIDHGYGMDCYAVGPTLGAGVAALVADGEIVYPWCYKDFEVLDNGPLRFTVKLEFNPLTVKGDSNVVETRVITLDAGSHLNKTLVAYAGLQEAMPVVTGIVLHDDGAVVTDAGNGYMTYVDPTTGEGNGNIFVGAVFPANVKEAKVVKYTDEEKKQHGNAEGHVLAFSDYEPGSEYTYYWGFGWDKADIKDSAAWNAYVSAYAQKVRNPLEVSIQ